MKKIFLHIALVVSIMISASVGFAKELKQLKTTNKLESWKKPEGLRVGPSLGFIGYERYILPEASLWLGYQINPYVSLNGKISIVAPYIWMFELSPKFNLTRTRVSPYVIGSVGIGGPTFSIDDNQRTLGVFSAGAGVDFNFTKRSSVYAEFKIMGVMLPEDPLPVFGMGYKFMF